MGVSVVADHQKNHSGVTNCLQYCVLRVPTRRPPRFFENSLSLAQSFTYTDTYPSITHKLLNPPVMFVDCFGLVPRKKKTSSLHKKCRVYTTNNSANICSCFDQNRIKPCIVHSKRIPVRCPSTDDRVDLKYRSNS